MRIRDANSFRVCVQISTLYCFLFLFIVSLLTLSPTLTFEYDLSVPFSSAFLRACSFSVDVLLAFPYLCTYLTVSFKSPHLLPLANYSPSFLSVEIPFPFSCLSIYAPPHSVSNAFSSSFSLAASHVRSVN
jgi:hypothetical protein